MASIGDAAKLCINTPCLIVIEEGGRVGEIIVAHGNVIAARVVGGEGRMYGEDAVKLIERLLPSEARIYTLRDRLLEWRDEEFTVWVRGIDLQHRQLVKALNSLYASLIKGDASYTYETLGFMREYAGFHFATEERFMERYGYPKLDEHRKQHVWFTRKTEELANLLRSQGLEAAIEMLVFLAEWTEVHIKRVDRDYGLWMRQASKSA